MYCCINCEVFMTGARHGVVGGGAGSWDGVWGGGQRKF